MAHAAAVAYASQWYHASSQDGSDHAMSEHPEHRRADPGPTQGEPDWETLVDFAAELADIARAETLSYFRRRIDVEHKGDRSPVTVADRATEQAMRKRIRERYPRHGVVGEEFGSNTHDTAFTWVIDPIDGTKSFITGKPTFGCLIALLENDAARIGVIEMPALRERWIGSPGRGTTLNAAACRTRDTERLELAAVYATTPDMFDPLERRCFDAVSAAARFRCFGADCYAYGLLASGHVDLVVEAGMGPHDFLALVPVVAGAGGVITDWTGAPLGRDSRGRVLAAATPRLHASALAVIRRTLDACGEEDAAAPAARSGYGSPGTA